jgi:DNA-directed RNA polymerase specialized sigma24 family protein
MIQARAFYTFTNYFAILISIIVLQCKTIQAQTLKGNELISYFKATDTSQIHKANLCYGDLVTHLNKERFFQNLAFLQKNEHPRIRARTFLYEDIGLEYLGISKSNKEYRQQFTQILQEARSLNDKCLLFELYSKFSRKCNDAEKLYYLIKSIEMQEQIGIKLCINVSYDYNVAAYILYEIHNYESAANYASNGVATFLWPKQFLMQYIHALDIAGAAYNKLQKPDSAIYFYRIIKNLVADYLIHPQDYQKAMTVQFAKIWDGVANGGIARALLSLKQYDSAYAFAKQNLQSSIYYQQWDAAAMAQSILGEINFIRTNYRDALTQYQQARGWALFNKRLPLLITSIEGLSGCFAKMGFYDSAYYYQQECLQWKDTLDKRAGIMQHNLIKTKVQLDEVETAYYQSQNEIGNQRRIRNLIVAGIFLAGIIVLLLYNRKRLQLRYQKQVAQMKVARAKEQINDFLQKISEKNRLIEDLQLQLHQENKYSVGDTLRQFTILTDDDWKAFKDTFEKVYPGYWLRLNEKLPQLSFAEQRLLALSKLGLKTKEMAAATGVSPDAIRTTAHRLRKKVEQMYPGKTLELLIEGV